MLAFTDPDDGAAGVTFATPDTGRGFVRTLIEGSRDAVAGLAGGTLDQAARDLAGVTSGILDGSAGRIARAAWDHQTYVETSTARIAAREESIDRLIEAVRQTSGVAMQNPLRGGYAQLSEVELKAELGDRYRREVEVNPALRINQGVKIFERQLREYMDGDPRVADAVATAMIDFSPEMIAMRADRDMQAAGEASPSVLLTLGAGLAGGVVPALRDPINAVGLFLGAGPSAARFVGARIADVAVREAAINAGITMAQQPMVQDWRRQAGLEAGFDEAARNVAMAAAFGGLFGAGAQGLREVMPRAIGGEASVKELRAALDKAGVTLDPESRAVLKAAERMEADDGLALRGLPKGVPEAEAREAVLAAIRHAEDPAREPPPPVPVALPRANASRARVTDEALPAEPGAIDTVDGKRVSFERFSPAELTADAATMQYKGGGDASGVTDRLRSVTRWDPLAGGRVFVFERLDGTRVIADGHQRLGLARRIAETDPQQRVELIGHLFREADGWSALDVRALAAKKNMQEGSGTPLDAARMLRDRPDLADDTLPKGGAVVRDGLYLARLSGRAFDMVNAGVIPEAQGARVGALALDPEQHAGIVADLARFRPETIRDTDILIGESMRAGFRTELQEDMFGTLELTVSLMGERMRVLGESVKALAQDKRVFGTLQREADRIEGAGNRLAREDNAARAAQAAGMGDLVVKLAQRTGPVSDALTAAAQRLAGGEKPAKAARGFLDELQAILDRDGLAALLADPQLKPSGPVAEPGTPQALAAAGRVEADAPPPRDDLTADMFGGPQEAARPEPARPAPAPSADLMDQLPVASRDSGGTRLVSRQDALAETEQLGFAADLVKGCRT